MHACQAPKSRKSTGFQAGDCFQIVLDGIIQHLIMMSGLSDQRFTLAKKK